MLIAVILRLAQIGRWVRWIEEWTATKRRFVQVLLLQVLVKALEVGLILVRCACQV
jgi:hypothetical protein